MGLLVDLPQMFGRDVGIHLGGDQILMPEHLLDGAQVASPIEEVRRERMAEGMRADFLVQGRLPDPPGHHEARPPFRKPAAAMIKK
jgi:hypothetical protein